MLHFLDCTDATEPPVTRVELPGETRATELQTLRRLSTALRHVMAPDLVFVAGAFDEETRQIIARLAFADGAQDDPFVYDFDTSPCQLVHPAGTVIIPCDLARLFPEEDGFEAYIGAPIVVSGRMDGHIAVMSRQPCRDPESARAIVELAAERIAIERQAEGTETERDELFRALHASDDHLRHRYCALREVNEFKTRLLGMIAHDLRNPLSAIMIQLELIDTLVDRLPGNTEKLRGRCAGVLEQAERMAAIISATLDRVRNETGALTLERRPSDLGGLAKIALDLNAEAARRKTIALRHDLTEIVTASIDPDLVLQAIDNLVSNAVKYTHPGGRVTVSVSCDAESAEIMVADTGQGLEQGDLKRIFRRFQTLSARPTAGEPSLGLGLANVKEIVAAHGGRVFAASEGRNRGACFRIRIPLS
ncbi:Adaptive-response sensory-kinase SasA [Roseivivax jejudonensis]|uniref:histidine kinase n=1 Tax=Roseivivax jejudonensis TaxID=1529041 RepID=A0A1X6Y506_9RHOB|nr:HAMP domain-containing sensor histidine kinase [Roseivivax jejudonensis]SLN10405.1 Adaptive-response sensory-kinase SasA [Roseivivax jejudonensis]